MITTMSQSMSYSYSTSMSYSYSTNGGSTDGGSTDGGAYVVPAWGQAWCTAYNAVKDDTSWVSEFTQEVASSVYPGILANGTGLNDYTCADIESWGTREEASQVGSVYFEWVWKIDANCCVNPGSTAVDCAANPADPACDAVVDCTTNPTDSACDTDDPCTTTPTLPECQTAHPDQNAGDKYDCMCEAFGGTAEGAEGWMNDRWVDNGVQLSR